MPGLALNVGRLASFVASIVGDAVGDDESEVGAELIEKRDADELEVDESDVAGLSASDSDSIESLRFGRRLSNDGSRGSVEMLVA